MRDVASIQTLLVYFAGDHDQCMNTRTSHQLTTSISYILWSKFQLIHCFMSDDLRICKLSTSMN